MATEYARQQQRRGTLSDWGNTVPLVGEFAVEIVPNGLWRIKLGDGVSAYPSLPYIGEFDPTARQEANNNAANLSAVGNRLTQIETNDLPRIQALEGGVQSNTAAIASRQERLDPGTGPGDLLQWNGSRWVEAGISPVADSFLRFDGQSGSWVSVPRGPNGYVLTVSPVGRPEWLPSGAVSVRSVDVPGTGTVEADFNAMRLTISSGEMVIVVHGGQAYLWTGGPGSGIQNATAGDFTQMGAAVAFASLPDFTNPVGGATSLALSPAVLLAWAANAGWDAGQF